MTDDRRRLPPAAGQPPRIPPLTVLPDGSMVIDRGELEAITASLTQTAPRPSAVGTVRPARRRL